MSIVVNIPKILREKLTEPGAEALVELFNRIEERSKEDTIELVEQRFEKALAQTETRIIRWMFIFWVGQIGVVTGILFTFLK